MASVATCPHCGLRVLVPNQTSASSRAKCPDCATLFDLKAGSPTPIPELIMLDDSPPPKLDKPADQTERPPNDTETLESLRTIFAKKDAAKPPKIQLMGSDDSSHNAAPANGQPAPQTKPSNPMLGEVAVAKARHKSETVLKSARDTVSEVQEYLDSLRNEHSDSPGEMPTFELPTNIDAPSKKRRPAPPSDTRRPEKLEDKDFDLTDVDLKTSDAVAPKTFAPKQAEELPVATRPKRRRRSSRFATAVGLLLGAMIGLSAGYYALLWMGGPSRDYLQIAASLPPQILPPSFAAGSEEIEPAPFSPSPSIANIDDRPASPDNSLRSTPPTVVFPREAASASNTQQVEPATFAEPPTAQPIQTTAHVLDAPTFFDRDLIAVLREAQAAEPGLTQGSLDDRAARRAKGFSYTKFCDLALILTFLDPEDAQGPAAVSLDEAYTLLDRLLADARLREEISSIAAVWLDSRHRQHGGILLVGRLIDGQQQGAAFEYQLELAGGKRLTLITDMALPGPMASQPIAVLGTVVDSPAEQIVGYEGNASRAIWIGTLFPL